MSNSPVLTDLLGKHVDVLPNYELVSKLEKVNMYRSDFKIVFLEKTFNKIGVTSNKLDTIRKISIYFPEVIDNIFYKLLIKKYGIPSSILKPDKIVSSDEWKNHELKSNKFVYSLKESSFADKPLIIIWKLKDFIIEVMPNYDNEITSIIFKSN